MRPAIDCGFETFEKAKSLIVLANLSDLETVLKHLGKTKISVMNMPIREIVITAEK